MQKILITYLFALLKALLPDKMYAKLYPNYQDDSKPTAILKSNDKRKKSEDALPIDGLVSGMAIHYGGCCNPIPGDAIVGIINTGTGVTIHNQTCHNLKNTALNPQRIIDVYWKDNVKNDHLYISRIRIVVENQAGSLADVTNIIARKHVNITNVRTTNRNVDYFEIVVEVEIKNVEQLEDVISALRISRKIVEVERLVG